MTTVLPPDVVDEASLALPLERPSGVIDTEERAETEETEGTGPSLRIGRAATAVVLSCLGAATVTGGVFVGAGGRVVAGLAAVLGVLLAVGASRLRGGVVANLVLFLGIGLIGLLAIAQTGAGNIAHVTALVRAASHEGNLLRPPVPFLPGWHAIVAWLLALVGVVAGWTAFVLGKPTVGLLLPLPLAVVAGISVPSSQQAATGIVAVVLFTAALGIVATGQLVGDDGDERPPLGFQVRRALRSLVVIGIITAALVAAARANFLFPKTIINPAAQAQLPHVVPPSTAPDRVLFAVQSKSFGPFRVGDLDVYDGAAWRFAPVADFQLRPVPGSGVVDSSVNPGVSATITLQGYSGNVLPALANLYGVVAVGPKLAYDQRSDTIRLREGQAVKGLSYSVEAAALPAIADLQHDTSPLPAAVSPFTQAPPMPPQIAQLVSKQTKSDRWDTFIALREAVLDTVTASGPGVPIAVPPSRVTDMLFGSKRATPFEVTAAVTLLARWAGVPARIGFGFEANPLSKGSGGQLLVRPRDAITYPEVYFPNFGWLPVIGNPHHAQPSDKNAQSNTNPSVLASSTFSVNFVIPEETPPPSRLGPTIAAAIGGAAALALLGGAFYALLPLLTKARARGRRRSRARDAGPSARLALAYAEWRDYAADLGYRHETDTPLAFLAQFGPDEEHAELAWLVTRGLWGDLRGAVDVQMAAAAEELSRSLRRRIASAHPGTLRFIAALSRLSLRHPFSPDLIAELDAPRKETRRALVPAPASA